MSSETGEILWWVKVEDHEEGPVRERELIALIQGGQLPADILIRLDGKPSWKPVKSSLLNYALPRQSTTEVTSESSGPIKLGDRLSAQEEISRSMPVNDIYPYDRVERGTISEFREVGDFGFIKLHSDKPKVFFHQSAFRGHAVNSLYQGQEVEVELHFNVKKGRIQVRSGKLLDEKFVPYRITAEEEAQTAEIEREKLQRTARYQVSKGSLITNWSNIRIRQRDDGDDRVISSLAELALDEPWSFHNDVDRYSILRNYLKFTFYRLAREEKILFRGKYAAFDTGLVNDLYEPIYALFVRDPTGRRPYAFNSFCVAGAEAAGRKLMEMFPERPKSARYITAPEQVLFDVDCTVQPQYGHVIEDAIRRGRYPVEFLRSQRLDGFDPATLDDCTLDVLAKYVEALKRDPQAMRGVASRLKDAIELAEKRAQWNYKTAIPNYFPTENKMGLLLPIALIDDKKPDLALVINKVNSKYYYGVTVYPLDMAYTSARLVCRPFSDWLEPESTIVSTINANIEDSIL